MSMWKPAWRSEVRDGRLRSRQDDEIGVARQFRARPHPHEIDRGLGFQRVEIVEIGDVRQHRDRDPDAPMGLRRGGAVERERVFRG